MLDLFLKRRSRISFPAFTQSLYRLYCRSDGAEPQLLAFGLDEGALSLLPLELSEEHTLVEHLVLLLDFAVGHAPLKLKKHAAAQVLPLDLLVDCLLKAV